jgi:hypothetical protein
MKNTLTSLLLATTLFGGAAGCVVRARATVPAPVAVVEVDEEPPPPRAVVVEPRPGFIYIEGRWDRSGGRWVWLDGHYERERVGYVWGPGRWDRRGNRHVWVEGSWRAGSGGGTRVRERRPPPAAAPPAAPPPAAPPPGEGVVRDHRHN